MADSIYKWSLTAVNNDAADSIINWRENQLPDTVNDSARAMMQRIAEWREDMTGGLITAGTQPGYTVTTNAVFDTLTNGRLVTSRVHATNAAGASTLNVNGLGARSIRKFGITGDLPVAVGDLQLGNMYQFMYSATANAGAGGWICSNPSLGTGFTSGTAMLFGQATAPTGWTKSVTHNDKALRVVSGGTGGAAGGATAFSTVFTATRTHTGTIGDTAITAAQMPSHAHTQQGAFTSGTVSVDHAHNQQGGFNSGGENVDHTHWYYRSLASLAGGGAGAYISSTANTNQTGGRDAGHIHGTTISGGTSGITANHTHATTISGATTSAGSGATHTHTWTPTNMDFAVQYVDVIICTKD